MYKKILFIGLLFFTMITKAHQADVSTTMLVEKEDNVWILQISSSLTAFQHEIKTNFTDTPYKTPEEFQEMVLKHIKSNFSININGNNITLGSGIVKLGHETKVVFQVFGIPSNIQSIQVKNAAFKDINKNQSALILLKKDFSKDRFVLNNDNEHTLNLYTDGNKFKVLDANKSDSSYAYIGWLLGGAAILAMVFMTISNMFKPDKTELKMVR
ncbi:hypothetical protein H0I23_16420 [Cellulophaga sp. HaHaR_3_176]|uniref:DUF6702 family protein n=1 Tax=Cellulophaga sp. HaHaR_3_176 TaxID=1942464 RepID=UPI001C1FB612|nr:DUF6702 family protein [Cellulophaga sp. HaHaR_3_176]QWX84011.1 hypothetical protein H0I23_16420 [Cellulophaga sp. HaHaR_3_176]